MKDLPNIYDFCDPKILPEFLNVQVNERFGVKVLYAYDNEKIYLFAVNGRYILPNKQDLIKYKGNGRWEIK
ncbi:hypothetical protein [Lactobacillus johnsonii]|uniref:Uncharacterized protein n=1 Tax=Lactobacillus johnsonii TaxID=33959 RepID=A0A9X6RV98_LACJH|nr:hypothetical protein [Lactobacillus johnsonii]OYS01776.1 hypothetical protein CBF54_08390 [Lactobacillus johnsonii]OYS07090.1 hypothetical protein CBF65_07955 [Lactobacillus johnsonii]OYS07711.1 hypothetical protein CBF62_04830 [Lactobacillus johnsonii]OYS10410.1 hypothetical protein CBF50_08875 [Lactobacillus johnsonii]OYS11213.1 hypothetical protein CBF63_01235 [Lactobacillus johnsonii]